MVYRLVQVSKLPMEATGVEWCGVGGKIKTKSFEKVLNRETKTFTLLSQLS